MKKRTVTKIIGSKEVVVEGIQSLHKGNIFRMYEPDTEEPVTNSNNGSSIFKAISDPYFSDKHGTWMIDIEDERLH